jgi:diguanylate cyclase (GGDEF)-like protein
MEDSNSSDSQTLSSTSDKLIFLLISGFISLGLLPFVVLRIMQEDWPTAILNVVAVIFTSSSFIHVLITKQTRYARSSLALVTIFIMLGTIFLNGPDNIYWIYPGLSVTFYLLPLLIAAIISLLSVAFVVGIIYHSVDVVFLLTFVISTTSTFAFLYAFSNRMQKQASALAQLATTDALTGVGNRRALEEKLLEITQQIDRTPEQCSSLIIFDIDYFKRINDAHGHGCGDLVLKDFVKVIESRIRTTDFLFRLGGEEFVLLLQNTRLQEASRVASELLKAIQQAKWSKPGLEITSSAGIAEYNGTETSYEWIERADKALYQAKNSGRNQLVISEH